MPAANCLAVPLCRLGRVEQFLYNTDFSFVSFLDVDTAAEKFTQTLLDAAKLYVTRKTLTNDVTTHPWLTDRCRTAIANKHAAVNTVGYKQACVECSQVLREEFERFVRQLKLKMSRLQRGSKQYWKLVKKLLLGSCHRLSVPSLA